MARRIIVDDFNSEINEGSKVTEEVAVQPEVEQPVKPVAKVNTSEKMIKIRTCEVIDCYIAKQHYTFAKGKEVSVPSDVAAILCSSQRAFRL